MKAAQLLRAGVTQSEVARRLGVTRQAVAHWAAALAAGGSAALARKPVGRPPRLSAAQLDKLKRLLAEAHLDMHALKSVLGVKR